MNKNPPYVNIGSDKDRETPASSLFSRLEVLVVHEGKDADRRLKQQKDKDSNKSSKTIVLYFFLKKRSVV